MEFYFDDSTTLLFMNFAFLLSNSVKCEKVTSSKKMCDFDKEQSSGTW